MNEFNRFLIVVSACCWIIFSAALIFLVWTDPGGIIDALVDIVEFLNDNNDTTGQLIVTLAGLTAIVLALLVIIVELAPEDEPKELRVEQSGATTVIPADALRLRLEEALLGLPEVTAARTRVRSRDKGVATDLELTVTPQANLAEVTQDAGRVVVDVVQTDLGLPVAGSPSVKFAFGGSKATPPEADPAEQRPLEPSPAVMAPIEPAYATPAPTTQAETFYPPAQQPEAQDSAPSQATPEPGTQTETFDPPADPSSEQEPQPYSKEPPRSSLSSPEAEPPSAPETGVGSPAEEENRGSAPGS